MHDYHYVIMSQQDMFKNQVLEEILRERSNYLLSKKRKNDFWLINCPNLDEEMKDIKKTNFYNQKRNEIKDNADNHYFMMIISNNKDFINWIKLRIGYFENIREENLNNQKYLSDGVYGCLSKNIIKGKFISNNIKIKPSILSYRFQKSMESYFVQN